MDMHAETCTTQLISYAGAARSSYIKAIEAIRNHSDYARLISDGDQYYDRASQAHFELLKNDPADQNGMILLMHAEDQLMSAETFRILAIKLKTILQDK